MITGFEIQQEITQIFIKKITSCVYILYVYSRLVFEKLSKHGLNLIYE